MMIRLILVIGLHLQIANTQIYGQQAQSQDASSQEFTQIGGNRNPI
jgi:hypothetical protein